MNSANSATLQDTIPASAKSEQKAAERMYFPGLNQVRMLAASAVIVYHIERAKNYCGFSNLHDAFFFKSLGIEGVRLFFVLSGFLISFILLKEIQKSDSVDIKKFYARRMLRIWPLYYLVVVLAFFAMPALLHPTSWSAYSGFVAQTHNHFFEKLGLYIAFLPNLCLAKFPFVLGAGQCWSLGVEEQFYLFWPFLLYLCRRIVPVAIATLFAVKPVLYSVLSYYAFYFPWGAQKAIQHQIEGLSNMVNNSDFECFAFGALAAWLIVKSPDMVRKVMKSPWLRAIYATVLAVSFGVEYPGRERVLATAFALFVLDLTFTPVKLGKLDGIVDRLGVISYGMYMYHPLLIPFVVAGIALSAQTNLIAGNLLVYGLTFAATAIVASLSYKYFETPFLQAKKKFEVIKTTSAPTSYGA